MLEVTVSASSLAPLMCVNIKTDELKMRLFPQGINSHSMFGERNRPLQVAFTSKMRHDLCQRTEE
jgi:hypothetical protein